MASRITPGLILEALREAVTIVEPGEVLAVRLAPGTPDDVGDQMKERARAIGTEHGIRVLLLEGEEFARLKAGDAR